MPTDHNRFPPVPQSMWGSTPPSSPGLYAVRHPGAKKFQPVDVLLDGNDKLVAWFFGMATPRPLSNTTGEWARIGVIGRV